MHAADPVHFPDVYAFSPGPMAFVVVEKIAGGRSLETEPADGFGDDLVAIVDALHGANVVHRDILPSNFLVAPDGHLRLIDFQFAVDMAVKKVDPWLLRRPAYHFLVFAAAMGPKGAWWDDAAFVDFLFPFLRGRIASRIGRLRFEIPFSPLVRIRLGLLAGCMKIQRMFARPGSRKRQSIDRRLERFSWSSSS
jgi:serine/threonine protein kinase